MLGLGTRFCSLGTRFSKPEKGVASHDGLETPPCRQEIKVEEGRSEREGCPNWRAVHQKLSYAVLGGSSSAG